MPHDEEDPRPILDDRSALARIVPQFAASATQAVATIRNATGANDLEAIWRAAHRLKSSAAWLGADEIARCCEEIERRAHRTTTLPSADLLDLLESAIAAALPKLRGLSGSSP